MVVTVQQYYSVHTNYSDLQTDPKKVKKVHLAMMELDLFPICINSAEFRTIFHFSGLIDFLVSKHKIAQELREKLIFKVGK